MNVMQLLLSGAGAALWIVESVEQGRRVGYEN